MKKLQSVMNRSARAGLSLILCIAMLCGNMLSFAAAVAESEPPSQVYYSQGIGVQNAEGAPQTQAVVTNTVALASYCSAMSVEVYRFEGEDKIRVSSGETLPLNASVELTLRFTLSNTMRDECGPGYAFYYDMPSGIVMTSTGTVPYYDNLGAHLMDWSATSGRITVQFTEEFYAQTRNDVEGFVSIKGTLSQSVIDNGKVTYNFPNDPNFVIKFPPRDLSIAKTYDTCRIEGSNMIIPYYIQFYAYDNMRNVVVTDVPGAMVNRTRTNIAVKKSSYSYWPSYAGNTVLVQGTDYTMSGNTFTILNVEKSKYYYVCYEISVPLDRVLEGDLGSNTPAADRKNTATLTWTDMNNATGTGTTSMTIDYYMNSFVSCIKYHAGAPNSTTGRVTFPITVKTTIAMEKLEITESPVSNFRNAVFLDVTDPANPITITTSPYVILNPEPNKEYKLTYTADYPYVEGATGLLTSSSSVRNNVSVKGYLGTHTFTAGDYYYCNYANGNFLPPTKVPTNTMNPIRLSSDGRYLMDFTVTVPTSNTANYYPDVFITDTLGDYMTLLPETISIAPHTLPNPFVTPSLVSNVGKTFKIKLNNYNGNYAYTLHYTVEINKDALEGGQLNSAQTDPVIIAARTNKVKLQWQAFSYSGSTAETSYEVKYDTVLEPATVTKSNTGIQYNTELGYYTEFSINFQVTRPMTTVTIQDTFGDMFAKTAYSGWTPVVKRGTEVYTGNYTSSYTEYTFTDIPAGTYSITYPAKLDFNGLTYTQILADERARTNTAILTYPTPNGPETTTATTTVPAYAIEIEKEGHVRLDQDDKYVTTNLGFDGHTYVLVDWTITLTADQALNLAGGKLMDSLFGRQCFADNDEAKKDTFLNIEGVAAKGIIDAYNINRIGTQDFLQEFTYSLGKMGESTTQNQYVYTFTSYVRMPDAQFELTVSNQAIFEHPLFGRYVAIAEDTIDWHPVGTWTPVPVHKELVSLNNKTNAPHVSARWKITIPIDGDDDPLKNGILTDYMNYWEPDSYFDLDLLDLDVQYANAASGAPAYKAPYIALNEDGINCLFIEFEEDIEETVVVYLTTIHANIDFIEKDRKYINFVDLEYEMFGGDFYSVDEASWGAEKTDLKKEGQAPRYDAGEKKFVIDWSVTLKDPLRVDMPTRILDTLPEGLTLIPSSVNIGTATAKNVTMETAGNAFIVHFTPSEEETTITFTTYIGDEYLDSFQEFINKADLLVRNPLSKMVAATSSAKVEFDALRKLAKTGAVQYNEALDQYEILWTITLDDVTRQDKTVYLNDRLPDGVSYVAGSITANPNRLQGIEMAPDNKSFIITLNPGSSSLVEIKFKTVIDESLLTQANEIFAFTNYVDLLGSHDVDDVIKTAEAICNLSGGVRTFEKKGYAHYDETETDPAKQFLIDWSILLDEQARVNREVTLHETLPDGLILGSVTATTGVGGVPVTVSVENKTPAANPKEFDIVFTPQLATTLITIRTYLDPDYAWPGTVQDYLNHVDLMSKDKSRVVDSAEAEVEFDTNKQFQKTAQQSDVQYDTTIGKYVIHWNLHLQAAMAVGRPIVIEDTLPAGLSLIPSNAVTSTDTEQPLALEYSYNSANRKVTINVTPAQADMTLVLHTSIDDDHLFYTDVMPTYHNVADVITYGLHGEATVPFGLKPEDALTKGVSTHENSNRITYTVEVNKKAIALANGAAEIVLTDTLHERYTMLLDTVKVYNGATGAVVPAQDYQVSYINQSRLLSFRLPNSRHLKITFDVLLNGTPKETVTINNTINLQGTDLSGSTGDKTFTVQEASAGLIFITDYVKIHKFDSANTSKQLPGAKFELWRVDGVTPSKVTSGIFTDATGQDGILYLPNQEGGVAVNGIAVNTLYFIREADPPTDYLRDTSDYYFIIPGRNTEEAQTAIAAIRLLHPDKTILISSSPQFDISNTIDLKSRIIVKKVRKGTQTLLSGAHLEIRDAATGGNLIHAFNSGSVETQLENLKLNNAHLVIGNTYYLVETQAPDGYKLSPPVAFTLGSKQITYEGKPTTIGYAEVTMEDDPTEVSFLKKDQYNRAVAGAVLEIIDDAGAVVTSWTSTTAAHKADTLLYGKLYGLREKTAPTGYIKTNTVIWFKLLSDGTVASLEGTATPPASHTWPTSGGSTSITLKNNPLLEIDKVDDDGEKVIGAGLQLFLGNRAVGAPIDTWTTDGLPHTVAKVLNPGEYTLHETTVPDGYEPAADRVITLTGNETETVKVSMVDKKLRFIDIPVTKTWSDSNNQDGIRPTQITYILNGNGTEVARQTVTGPNWNYTFEDMPLKDANRQPITYTLAEAPIIGYTASVSGSAENGFTVLNTHTPAKVNVVVKKVWNDNNNAGNTRPITGISVTLRANGTVYETVNLTEGNWQKIWSNLDKKANGVDIVYTVDEITVPTGYVASSLTDANAAEGYLITLTNTLANVVINKFRAAIDGTVTTTALGGAKFEVWNEAGTTKLVNEFTIADDGTYTISGNLSPGTYTLKETGAPDGFYPSTNITFTVTGNDEPVKVYDRTTAVAFRKVDSSDDSDLPGAELGIFDSETATTPLYSFTTAAGLQVITASGQSQIGDYSGLGYDAVVLEGILATGKDYYLRELTTPAGYLTAEPVTFRVSDTMEITEVVMEDDPIELIDIPVTKTWDDRGVTGLTHPAITIDLYRSDDYMNYHRTTTLNHGTTSYTFTGLEKTNADGVLYTYTVREQPVAGYATYIDGFNIINQRTSVDVIKVTTDILGVKHPLAGAVLEIWSMGVTPAKVYGPFTTDGTTHTLTGVLTGGVIYELREITAPTGFYRSYPIEFQVPVPRPADRMVVMRSVPTMDVLEMEDRPTLVVVQKTNTAGTLIPGAQLEIRKGTEVVWSGTTSNLTQIFSWEDKDLSDIASLNLANGSIVLDGILEAGGEYTLVETYPPSGYVVADPVDFTVEATVGITAVTMEDEVDLEHYTVKFYKIDDYGDPVIGATITLTDLESTETPKKSWTWTTTDEPYELSLLGGPSERYEITEIIVPEGYEAADSITFQVAVDSQAVMVGVTMVDEYKNVIIRGTKTWNDHGLTEDLPDAVFDLYRNNETTPIATVTLPHGETDYVFDKDKDGNDLAVSDANRVKYTYTVRERVVPGYATIVSNGVNFKNIASRVTILKCDENDELVPGVVLEVLDKDGNVVETWNTADANANPKTFTGVFTGGETYTLHEVSAPMGFELAEDQDFVAHMEGDKQSVVMVNKREPWEVTIRKVGLQGTTEQLLPGAVLTLYDTDDLTTPIGSWNTTATADNPKVFTNLDPTKNYVLKETTTPAGFIPAEDISFNFNHEDSTDGALTVTMINRQTSINVEKLAGTAHLAGAWLEIRDPNGLAVRRWKSNGSAQLILGLEVDKEYTLHEILPPAGYVTTPYAIKFKIAASGVFTILDPTIPNTRTNVPGENLTPIGNPSTLEGLNPNGGNKLTVNNEAMTVQIQKRIAGTNTGLAGATLELYKGTPLTAANLVERWDTTTSPHTLTKPLEVGKTYILHEAAAPKGYYFAKDQNITITEEKTQLYYMDDVKTKVIIEKRDALDGNFVSGAQLVLQDSVTQETIVWTSNGSGKLLEGLLWANRKYILSEIKSPMGYFKADKPIEIIFSQYAPDAEKPPVVMVDPPIVVKLSKVDEDGIYLGGAKFSMYYGNTVSGSAVAQWTSSGTGPDTIHLNGANGHNDFIEGQSYTVREDQPPQGYYASPDFTFTVTAQRDGNGQVMDITRVIRNFETRVAISKYDQQTGARLSGASLKLVDASGATVESWVSNGTAHKLQSVLTAGAEYTLIETAAPTGFAIAAPVKFTVPLRPATEGEEYVVRMDDPHIYLFSKQDFDTKNELPKAELLIRDKATGTIVVEWTSSTKPFELIGALKPGHTYVMEEKTAPVGYDKAANITFTVKMDGSLEMVVMLDRKTPPPPTTNPPPPPGPGDRDITVTKTWVDNNNAAGNRPSSITLQLFQKLATDASYPTTPYQSASMSGTGNTWTYTFTGLPKASSGVTYNYLVQEVEVEDYAVAYANNGERITNTYEGAQPTPTPFATPTAPRGGGTTFASRTPLGVKFVDGEWVYIDEYDTPLGVVPLTGDNSNWPLWIAAAMVPMLGIGVASAEILRRKKKAGKNQSNKAG